MADLGDFYCAVTNIAGATSAQNLVSIENPSANTINILIKNVDILANSTLTTALSFFYTATRLSVIPTGGTSQSIQQNDTRKAASQAIVRLNPTGFTAVAGNYWTGSPGGALLIGLPVTGISALPGWSNSPINTSRLTSVILQPGEGFLIQVAANNSAWTHGINLHWFEQDR